MHFEDFTPKQAPPNAHAPDVACLQGFNGLHGVAWSIMVYPHEGGLQLVAAHHVPPGSLESARVHICIGNIMQALGPLGIKINDAWLTAARQASLN